MVCAWFCARVGGSGEELVKYVVMLYMVVNGLWICIVLAVSTRKSLVVRSSSNIVNMFHCLLTF